MTDVIYGGDRISDGSIVVRCSCAAGCIVAFDRWDDEDDERFNGEFYAGFHPIRWRDRVKAAWTCLRGREHTASSMILSNEAVEALGKFLLSSASRKEQQ